MIRVIGMGPGNIRYLTYEAIDKIKTSSKVLAFGRIARTVETIRDDVIRISRVDEIINYINEDKEYAILASGDPCFYGILEYLKNKGIIVDEVVPGLSSFQYMMAKLKKSWHDVHFISLHGREEDIDRILKHKVSVVLTDSKNTADSLSKTLYDKGITGKIYVGFNLSYEDETIVIKSIGDEIENISSLAVVVIENEMD